jgi:adenosylmethionine---8-amino-7-oxononanoate aminotransferase
LTDPNTNAALLQRSKAAVWHPCTQMKRLEALPLVPISHGEGVWLYDYDGRRYLDAISSWWVNLFGHRNPRIIRALNDQLETLEHVLLAGFTHEPAVQLGERLTALLSGRLGHCFFASDGASAVEIALKMSFHYWRNQGRTTKTQFLSLANSYHGETLGALSVTDVALFKDCYAPLLRINGQVPSPDWRLAASGENPCDYAVRCAEALEQELQRRSDEVAALIVEPLVQGASGMAMYEAEYLRLARAACDRHGVHLIADEIMTGFGRTGTMFAHQQAGIVPDFVCLSKGLTGGYLPMSLVLTSDAIYGAFYDDSVARAFLHSHSYSGNPLACRAALATLDIFEHDSVLERNRLKAAHLSRCARQLVQHKRVKGFRNCGMIWAFEVDGPGPEFNRQFCALAQDEELLLRPLGNTVYFMPPYVISDEECGLLVDRTCRILDRV